MLCRVCMNVDMCAGEYACMGVRMFMWKTQPADISHLLSPTMTTPHTHDAMWGRLKAPHFRPISALGGLSERQDPCLFYILQLCGSCVWYLRCHNDWNDWPPPSQHQSLSLSWLPTSYKILHSSQKQTKLLIELINCWTPPKAKILSKSYLNKGIVTLPACQGRSCRQPMRMKAFPRLQK